MTSSDPRQADETAETANETGVPVDLEALNDDAWMDACRAELEDDGSQNEADPAHATATDPAIEKTGDDAMSKFGHAIGALAEPEDDLDDRTIDYAAEIASPSSPRDEAVAPHIAAAERELERSKAGPVDIFDRIAQAAESQFDESRGSTSKRVSELVDDRRVGTKRWTPSKTMKQRMEKLEAARAAASGEQPAVAAQTTAPETAATAAAATVATATAAAVAATASPEVQAASAPSSSQATVVSPGQNKKPTAKADPAPMTEEQKVTISRRGRQADVEDKIESQSDGAADAAAEAEEEVDADGLRVVPGARGRRRDRARKSRLDEDFEKIFDDEGKPSINSLRRKLRSSAAEEAAAAAEAETEGKTGKKKATGSTTEEHFGAETEDAPKKGLFSRLLNAKRGKDKAEKVSVETAEATETVTASSEEDDLVAAFETDSTPLVDDLDFEGADDDTWQEAVDTERKQKQIAMPIIAAGGAILFGGLGYFAYKFLTGM